MGRDRYRDSDGDAALPMEQRFGVTGSRRYHRHSGGEEGHSRSLKHAGRRRFLRGVVIGSRGAGVERGGEARGR